MIGQILLHYRITEKIGEGGMGAVYKAIDTHLDRPVAIKVLPPDKVADPERKQRFVQEAKAASALRHPNIIVIHDIASDRGRDFIAMEFVEGKSLDLLIGRKGLRLNEALGYAVLNEEPKPAMTINEALPPEVERILNRCLRKDLQRRWQTMSDLKVALQDLKEDSESGRLPAAQKIARAKKRTPVFAVAAASVLVLAAVAVILKLVVLKPRGSVEYEITPLTFDSGLTSCPTISLDGNLMAYSSDRGGDRNFDIWVQQVSGGKPLRLTDHPADDWLPSFSPDGSQIAFRSERDGGGIYLIDALGGEPRRVADKGFVPRFSPDGRFIACVVVPPSLESRLFRMSLISPKGGESRPFLPDFMVGYSNQGAAPVWSPDAKHLMFRGRRVDDPEFTDWWMAPVDGGEPVRTHAKENLGLTTIVQYPVGWSEGKVYFVSGTTIEGVNLFRASIDPKDWTVRGPAEPITTGPGMKLFPSVLRDGRILFTNMRAMISVWSLAARPDEAVVSAHPEKLTQDLMQKFSPSISRDGTKAAFIAFGGAQATKIEVRVKDLRSGQETAIPMQAVNLDYAILSPDGSTLAYQDIVAGKRRTYVLAPGASAGREVCESCSLLDIFPDNEFAVVQVEPGELGKMSLKTGEKTPLLTSPGETILDVSLSPDGKRIAWLGGRPDGRVDLRITPVGGPPGEAPDTVTIAEADSYLGSPAWSPNGRYLFYLSEKSGRCSVFAQELDPRTKKPIGEAREVYFSPDSRLRLNFPLGNGMIRVAADKILFMACEMEGNIYLATPKKR